MSKKCNKCGAMISDTAIKCQYCGCQLNVNSSKGVNMSNTKNKKNPSKGNHSPKRFYTLLIFLLIVTAFVYYCGRDNTYQVDNEAIDNKETLQQNVDNVDDKNLHDETESNMKTHNELPYSDDNISERVVIDYGNRTIRTQPDESLSFPELMKNKKNCFLLLSKKDYYLYVYEPQGKDTIMLARYDCAFALKKGDKTKQGDMRTPHCSSFDSPFSVSEIKNSKDWCHDFGDGRGSIRSYGEYFIRLRLDGHQCSGNRSIGIHGSTNNAESVPGRASEGCIRLKDVDIKQLRETFVTENMKVIIKAETVDDYPFEIKAMKKQNIIRKRHFNPEHTLTNEQVNNAEAEVARSKNKTKSSPDNEKRGNNSETKNKTIDDLTNNKKTSNKNKSIEDLEQVEQQN